MSRLCKRLISIKVQTSEKKLTIRNNPKKFKEIHKHKWTRQGPEYTKEAKLGCTLQDNLVYYQLDCTFQIFFQSGVVLIIKPIVF